jgi:hypothetical protein
MFRCKCFVDYEVKEPEISWASLGVDFSGGNARSKVKRAAVMTKIRADKSNASLSSLRKKYISS